MILFWLQRRRDGEPVTAPAVLTDGHWLPCPGGITYSGVVHLTATRKFKADGVYAVVDWFNELMTVEVELTGDVRVGDQVLITEWTVGFRPDPNPYSKLEAS